MEGSLPWVSIFARKKFLNFTLVLVVTLCRLLRTVQVQKGREETHIIVYYAPGTTLNTYLCLT